jgi:hypothetical protein
MTEVKTDNDEKKEDTKLDLMQLVEVISESLHKKHEQVVIRSETKILGAFYPAEQTNVISSLQKKLTELEDRLSALESSDDLKESSSAEPEATDSAPESTE